MRGISDQRLIKLGRNLRKNQTPWEAKLWFLLRNCRLRNFKFRRQCPVGSYIVDFCCLKKKLIIELDGSQHQIIKNKLDDAGRDKYLRSQGYTVLRIYNNDLDKNIEGVLDQIYEMLRH
jgi:very-short-patch-repair endonuclease